MPMPLETIEVGNRNLRRVPEWQMGVGGRFGTHQGILANAPMPIGLSAYVLTTHMSDLPSIGMGCVLQAKTVGYSR